MLFHGVAVAEGNGVVLHRLLVDSHAIRTTNGVHTTIALAYLVLLLVLAVEVETKLLHDFLCLLGHSVLLGKGEDGQLNRCQGSRQLQHDTTFAIGQLLLGIGVAHNTEEHAVDTDRGLDDVRSIALTGLRIEVLNLLTRIGSMLTEVEVGTRVDTLNFLETERHVEFDVCGSIGIVSQFVVVVETIVLSTEAQSQMPSHTGLLPLREPLQFGTGLHEVLHLHLLELTHAEDELTGNDFVTESLTYLCDTEGQLHATRFLHVQVVDKDSLCRLRTQVDCRSTIGSASDLGLEHEVELAHFSPVACATDWAYDSFVKDDLSQFFQVVGVQSL